MSFRDAAKAASRESITTEPKIDTMGVMDSDSLAAHGFRNDD
jgi:hypothetical protein